MKPAFHIALGLEITLAFFLCGAVLKAQSRYLDIASAGFAPEYPFVLPTTSTEIPFMTSGASLRTADLLQELERPAIPFAQFQRAGRLLAVRMPAGSDPARRIPSGEFDGFRTSAHLLPAPAASASSAAGLTRAPTDRGLRNFDAKYLWLNTIQISLAFADIEATQHCIDEHTCREGNPLMPSSQAGKLGISLGIGTFTAVASYRLKKQRSRGWWIAPAVSIAGHAAGLASGLVLR